MGLTERMTPGGGPRRDATTSALLDAAAEELIEVGQADFTMEGVARRAFFSVGAVYDRWPDREQCIADVAAVTVPARLAAVADAIPSLDAAVNVVLTNPDRLFTLIGECLIAGQTMPAAREPAQALVDHVQRSLRPWMGPGMSWYLSTLAVGGALLDLMEIPRLPSAAAPLFVDACRIELDRTQVRDAGGVDVGQVSLPDVPSPSRSDPVAAALIEAARAVLAQEGASAAGAREIASAAGVTTGALYRRYEGKSRLLADVLVTQLQPDRYLWTWDLIAAFAKDDPYEEAAGVLADRIVEACRDRAGQQVLLQIGVAARNEPALRAQVHQRITIAVQAREEMIRQFADVGLVRADVDPYVPAWGFQALPVGIRAMLPLVEGPDPASAQASMHAMLLAASPI